MRHIPRYALTQSTMAVLAQWTAELTSTSDHLRLAVSKTRWKRRRQTRTLREVEGALVGMNHHHQRCMYCEHNEATQLDHFEPRAQAPERTFDWLNLLLACDVCNSNTKRKQHTRGDGIALLDPTADDPAHRLEFLP